MFIHWGPYSLASVEASWPIMTPTPASISEAEYRELPRRFNPSKFDPNTFIGFGSGRRTGIHGVHG
jgi:alpha-L-fucosidase